MRDYAGSGEQQRDMHGKEAVFRKFVVGMIGAVNSGHEVRVIEEQREKIECEGPLRCSGGGHQYGEKQKWSGPRSATHEQIQPCGENPHPLGCGRRCVYSRLGGAQLGFQRCHLLPEYRRPPAMHGGAHTAMQKWLLVQETITKLRCVRWVLRNSRFRADNFLWT